MPEQPESLRPLLQRLRGELHEQLAKLRKVQEEQRNFWRSQAQTLAEGKVTDVAAEWQKQAAAACGAIAFELGRIAAEAAAALPGYASDDADVSDTVKLARALVPPRREPGCGGRPTRCSRCTSSSGPRAASSPGSTRRSSSCS